MSMKLVDGILAIDIPNSECHKNNSLRIKKLKSSVGEFYISDIKKENKEIVEYLGFSDENDEISFLVDKEKTDEYINNVEDRFLNWEILFRNKLDYFFQCAGGIKKGDDFESDSISMVLSKPNIKKFSRYLNIPKTNEFNKHFYGLLLGELTYLMIGRNCENKLTIYPVVKDNYTEIIERNLDIALPKKTIKVECSKLLMVKCPNIIKSYAQDNNKQKNDDTNYEKLAGVRTKIGELGEKLVYDYEKSMLNEGNISKLENVSKKGLHYDIKSYDNASGKEKYIEVKSTTRGIDEPFYLSHRELEYLKTKENNVIKQIYRVYNARNNQPKFFLIDCENIGETLVLLPVNYEASKKNKD